MKIPLHFISALFLTVSVSAAELPAQPAPQKTDPGVTSSTQGDVNNPVNTLPTEQQQESPQSAYFGNKTDRPVSAHKVNYFSINHWPAESRAQVKFQISMKFRVLEPNLYVMKYNLFPAYIGYTQKSLWDEGRNSMPFEETNYNPEFFLDYPVRFLNIGRLKLRNIIVCPFEHESNGLAGIQSRSWNRQYLMLKFGLESKEKLEIANSFLADKASLYVKLWQASGYSGQDDYLRSLGSRSRFLDYMGRGEVGISIRNFLWGGSLKNHQLDIKTPVFRDANKDSYQLEFRQQLPDMNFALYLQYWYGYGETLLRFDQFGRRGFAGLSFSY
jgi:phospholipase A1